MTNLRAGVMSGDCLTLLPGFGDNSADSCVTDPPYGLSELPRKLVEQALAAWLAGDRSRVPDGRGFMGKDWDKFVPPPAVWDEVYRVLKPGGYLLAFAAPRTADLMGLSIRLAGFEVRDSLHWMYGSGFPKSLDVSKAIDKAAGAEREVIGYDATRARPNRKYSSGAIGTIGGSGKPSDRTDNGATLTASATENAARWEGWGTALKPAHESIIVARKPLAAGTVAANVLEFGTGALNIDACKVAHASEADRAESEGKNRHADFGSGPRDNHVFGADERARAEQGNYDGTQGRWPPNLLLTHSAGCNGQCVPDCPVAGLDEQSGVSTSTKGKPRKSAAPGEGYGMTHTGTEYADTGGASRFYPQFTWDPEHDLPFLYSAKAGKRERPVAGGVRPHPTVKPLTVARWLVRLVTQPGGLVLDPFTGTAPVVQACLEEGFRCAAMDSWPDAIAHARVRLASYEGVEFT